MGDARGIYFDSALIAKFYLNEPGRKIVRETVVSATRVCSSAIATVEVAAAFHRNVREGRLDAPTAGLLQVQLASDFKNAAWKLFPVTEAVLDDVRSLFARLDRSVHLRTLDAVHLVTARGHGFDRLHTNDRHLLAACAQLGIQPVNPLA
jgi:predicted nucleic acid-binding protein